MQRRSVKFRRNGIFICKEVLRVGQIIFIPNNYGNLETLHADIYRTFIGLREKLLAKTFSERIS
jgi:hypothetical protein